MPKNLNLVLGIVFINLDSASATINLASSANSLGTAIENGVKIPSIKL